ncbi:MAG TPA: Rid family detoxifying hydrolase [Rhizomicrobium sp.]|nr:Rid family detoxifying hydrolase [Rhizomicrobium sp.]
MRKALWMLAMACVSTPALADKTLVESPDAPKAIGPYSQAIASGKLVFVSGSLPFDPAGKIDTSKEDVSAQTRRALDNIVLELKAAKLTPDDVVSATVYVTDIDDFPAVNAVYASYFHPPYPARAFVQVAKLLRGAKVEISVIAARK